MTRKQALYCNTPSTLTPSPPPPYTAHRAALSERLRQARPDLRDDERTLQRIVRGALRGEGEVAPLPREGGRGGGRLPFEAKARLPQ